MFTYFVNIQYLKPNSEPHIKDLEPSNIEHTNKVLPLLLSVQSLVTLFHEELEDSIKDSLGHGTNGVVTLVDVLTLCHKLGSDLYPGFHVAVVN